MGLYNINLGNIFMSCISSDNVDLEEYNSTAEAMKKAHSGDVWAVVAIPAKFSVDTVLRHFLFSRLRHSQAWRRTLSYQAK
eukprot:m.152525 g.152525  ORF g.152525 m.152525 type:complete len:81 (+) comp38594_c0_seq10:1243-1485(+)